LTPPQEARLGAQAPAHSRYFLIQGLRALAAFVVVIHHATELWSEHVTNFAPAIWETGAAGVDIFFVISGFVMAVSALRPGWEGKDSAKPFILHRLIRIVPLYWIVTTLEIPLYVRHVKPPLLFMLASYLFIPWRDDHGRILPMVAQGWTLTFEMFFYLWFALALFKRINPVRLLTPIFVLLAAIGFFWTQDWPAIMTLTRPILLEFLGGLWLGWATLKGLKVVPAISVLVGALGIAGFLLFPVAATDTVRLFAWGTSALCVVASAVWLEPYIGMKVPTWIRLLGDASYSLYLVHAFALHLEYQLLLAMHILPTPGNRLISESITILIAVAFSLPASILLHKVLEKPITDYLKRRFTPGKALAYSSSREPQPENS
jgi:peptidoglycan/LPS O-acetylase OafA/YrhL